jgi:hypothetical protein
MVLPTLILVNNGAWMKMFQIRRSPVKCAGNSVGKKFGRILLLRPAAV